MKATVYKEVNVKTSEDDQLMVYNYQFDVKPSDSI